MQTKIIGAPLNRVDGRLKVTGKATYAAEFPVTNLAYGFPVLRQAILTYIAMNGSKD